MTGALGLIVVRDWQKHKLRLALTIAGIALGVSVFFAIQTVNRTLSNSLNSTIEKLAGKATLQIAAGEVGFSEDVLKTVRETPGLQTAEPVTETVAITTLGRGERILILGLDTSSELTLYNDSIDQGGFVVKNPLAFANRKDSVAVTRTLADRFSLKDGDKFTINVQSGTVEVTVRAIFSESGIGEVYDGNVAVMDIYSAQALFGRGTKIDRIDVLNAPGVSVDELQLNLTARLPAGIEAVRPDLRGQSLENSITSMQGSFTIMSVFALTIGIFIIFNSFTISLNQRWKEIAILRAIGVGQKKIRFMFLAEAIVLGIVGSALGIGAGLLVARAAMGVVLGVTASIYGFVTTLSGLDFDLRFAAFAFSLGVLASLIAAWIPARAASRLEPALALRNIETRQSDERAGRLRIVCGFALIVAGLLLTRFTPPMIGSYIQVTYALFIQVGMILLLPRIIEIGAWVLRPVLSVLFGAEGIIAVETMARSPRRTVATAGAIMIGLAFVFSNAALVQSQKAALNRSMDKALAADILLTASENVHSKTYHFTEKTAETIMTLPGVAAADAIRVTSTDLDAVEVTILAHDMRAYFDISPDLLDLGDVAAARELTARGEGVLISNNLGLRWNKGMGDIITIAAPRGELKLPVVGMLDYYRSQNGTIFIERELYKRYWDDTDVDYLFIDLEPGEDRAAFKDKVRAAIDGTERAFIYTHEEYRVWVMRLIDQFFLLMYMQMVVAVLVASIGLINTMVISVAERRRELGIFRAIGGLRRQVVKMVLLEAIVISLIGFAASLITAVMNTYFLINTGAKLVAGFELEMKYPFGIVALAIPLVIILAILSSWLPARNAARLNVVEAIGYE